MIQQAGALAIPRKDRTAVMQLVMQRLSEQNPSFLTQCKLDTTVGEALMMLKILLG